MKTIIRIGETIQGTEQLNAEKLSAFGVKQLTAAFSKRREDFKDGLLIVEDGADNQPVFITLSSRPPEIVPGHIELYGVFWPTDSQEPIATFVEEADAEAWAASKYDHLDGELSEYVICPVEATHKLGVQVSLATMVWRGSDLLFCRMKGTKQWTFPEGSIGLGEAVNAAAERTVLDATGIEVENLGIPARIPYINTYLRMAGQHFLTVMMKADYKAGTAIALDDAYDRVEWCPANNPPRPLFGLVEGAIRVLSKYGPAETKAEAQ